MWCRFNGLIAKVILVLSLGTTSQVGLASTPLVGDGNPIYFNDLGLMVPVPTGWQISRSERGMSLSLKEPERRRALQTEADRFRRELSIRQTYETVAIDEAQTLRLKAELEEIFASEYDSFQVSEDIKFFNYRGENDGIVAYSFAKQGELAVTMMHVLIAGELNRVVMSSSHLASDFDKQMDESWKVLNGVDITGAAPDFWAKWQLYFKGGAGFLGLLILGSLIRRWRVRRWLKMSDMDGVDELSGRGEIDDESTAETPELPTKKARRSAPPALPTPLASELAPKKKVVGKKVGPAAKVKLPPPPAKKAVAQSFDANLEDDWQLVSGHDDFF